MKVVVAPKKYSTDSKPLVFLAGGITNCPEWQDTVIKLLKKCLGRTPATILNPRRANFPIHDPNAARVQITWEYTALNLSDIFSMWFSAGVSDQPICMYELGRHLARNQFTKRYGRVITSPAEVCIGVEPGYRRAQDVYIQSELIDHFEIATTLEDHVNNIVAAIERYHIKEY